jgi:hypothetical protein
MKDMFQACLHKLWETPISFSCPSAHMHQLGSHRLDFHENTGEFYENLSKKSNFG